MLKRFVMGTAAAALIAMLGVSAYAWDCSTDCDTTLRQGRVFEAWDSTVVILFIVEAMIAAVQNLAWEETKDRIKTLEGLFDQIRLFRKFT